jgi:hypothetical protein
VAIVIDVVADDIQREGKGRVDVRRVATHDRFEYAVTVFVNRGAVASEVASAAEVAESDAGDAFIRGLLGHLHFL